MANILLVEDDLNQQKLYQQEMEGAGYNVITASDGSEGLKKFQENQSSIDLVVLDIVLPGMDGIELMGKILGRDNSIPIIIHTAYAQYKENYMTWTAEHYIMKNPDQTLLLDKIAEVLTERGKK